MLQRAKSRGVTSQQQNQAKRLESIYTRRMRRCARPGCSRPATIVLRIDAGGRQALFVSLADDPFGLGNALCELHADATSVPRGWTFTDGRDDQTSMLVGSRTKPLSEVPGSATDSESRAAGGSRRPHRPQRRRPREPQPGLFADDATEPEAGPGPDSAEQAATQRSAGTGTTETPDPDEKVAAPAEDSEAEAHEADTHEAPEDETGVFQRFADTETSEDLDAILHADSPLLSRAFRGVRSDDD